MSDKRYDKNISEEMKRIIKKYIYNIPHHITNHHVIAGIIGDKFDANNQEAVLSKVQEDISAGEKLGLLAYDNRYNEHMCVIFTDCGVGFFNNRNIMTFECYDKIDHLHCKKTEIILRLKSNKEVVFESKLLKFFSMDILEKMMLEVLDAAHKTILVNNLEETLDTVIETSKAQTYTKKMYNNLCSTTNKEIMPRHIDDYELISAGLPIADNPIVKSKYEFRKAYYCTILDLFKRCIGSCSNKYAAEQNLKYYQQFLRIKDNYTESKRSMWELGKYRYMIPYDLAAVMGFDSKALGNSDLQGAISTKLHIQKNRVRDIFSMFTGIYAPDHSLAVENISYYGRRAIESAEFIRKEPFRILVTATMSAGKSTFINAIVGREVCKAQNMACTSRIHHIYSKYYDDGLIGKYDGKYSLHTYDRYSTDENESDSDDYMSVGINGLLSGKRVEFIDTPGGNSSQNPEHREITRKFIMSKKYQLLLFVINYTNQLPDDEVEHIRFIRENVDEDKIVFILNKIDGYDEKDHLSIPEMAASIQNFLKNECGFSDPIIYPVSARYSLCAKKILSGDTAFMNTRTKRKDYENYVDFFEKNDLNGYYENISCPCNETNDVNGKKSDEIIEAENLLKNCGMTYIEAALLSQIK